MKKVVFILFVLLTKYSNAQIADAGADHPIYLTEGNTTTIGGISSGTSYSWTKIYDVQQPQAGYPLDPAIIVNPLAATTSVTGLIQGVWYYQLAVTTGGITKKDTVVVKVDYAPPPDNYQLALTFPFWEKSLDTAANNREDTTQFAANKNSTLSSKGYFFYDRSRYPSMMVDSSLGKFYSTIEDGYYWPQSVGSPGPYGTYARTEVFMGSSYITDTTKTYIYEWKGYFPQSIRDNMTASNACLAIMQWHAAGPIGPSFNFRLIHDSLQFQDNLAGGNSGTNTAINIMSTEDSNLLNKAHTYRVEMRQGAGYIGQDAYIKVYVDGNLKYQRDTGQVGATLQQDWTKFGSLYDYRRTFANPDSLSRGKKFSLVTEAFNIYTKGYPIVKAGNIINTNTSSVTLSGSVEKNPDKTVTYSWSKVSGNGIQTITNDTTLSPTISGLISGSYVFRLTATQSDGMINYSDVIVNVINGDIMLRGNWKFVNLGGG